MCEAPDIDSSIGFFDGFDKKTVGVTYGVLIGFSVLWQVYIYLWRNPKVLKQWDQIHEEQRTSIVNLNQTGSRDTNFYR